MLIHSATNFYGHMVSRKKVAGRKKNVSILFVHAVCTNYLSFKRSKTLASGLRGNVGKIESNIQNIFYENVLISNSKTLLLNYIN